MSSQALRYMPKLDGLRAIAAMMIVLVHYFEDLNLRINFNYGGNGIHLFFILSGFLISLILFRIKKQYAGISKFQPWLGFIFRRILRLFPAYFLFIGLLFLLNVFGGLYLTEPKTEWYYFVYLQNFLFHLHGWQSPLISHTWSLAVEEQFYLFWPIIILQVPQKKELGVLIFVTLLGVFSEVYYSGLYTGVYPTVVVTFNHFDTLGVGAILAYIVFYQIAFLIDFMDKYAGSLFSIFFPLSIVMTYLDGNPVLVSITTTMAGVFIVYMASSAKKFYSDVIFKRTWLQYLGKISYGIYLYHKPVPFFFLYFCEKFGFQINNSAILIVLFCLITFVLAHLSWKYFESYFLRLKDKFAGESKFTPSTNSK